MAGLTAAWRAEHLVAYWAALSAAKRAGDSAAYSVEHSVACWVAPSAARWAAWRAAARAGYWGWSSAEC